MYYILSHRRVYEIMNANFTSGVSFTEFVQFCSTYLVLDEEKLHAFTFRLLSRRGIHVHVFIAYLEKATIP